MSSRQEDARSVEFLQKAMPPKGTDVSSPASGVVLNKCRTVIMRDGELSVNHTCISIIAHDEPVFNRFFQCLQKILNGTPFRAKEYVL